MLPYGPNWYTAVMGTGIVAVTLQGLPFHVAGAGAAALAFWVAALALLLAVTTTMLLTWRREPALLRRQYDDPAMAPFYGAPAMALMTVGAGALALGVPGALGLDAALWTAGTVLGIGTAVAVPLRAITVHELADDSASPTWLMPVVPPMVSATTGAALVPHVPAGQAQQTLLLVCYALFGMTLLAGVLVLSQVWQRLLRYGAPAAAGLPTVWIVLGFLGQSTAAVQHLGVVAQAAEPAYGHALAMLAVVYGVPVWGFTLLWLGLAVALTVRQAREGLPFAPTWWSFTFPVGTVVAGTSSLAVATGLDLFRVAAGIAMAGLLLGWVVAAAGTSLALIGSRRRSAEVGTNRGSARLTPAG